jgi:IS6 family transposase
MLANHVPKRGGEHISPTDDSWRMDGTYLKILGAYYYFYRAEAPHGETIDFCFSKHRGKASVRRFFMKALGTFQNSIPRVITIDENQATTVAGQEHIYVGLFSCHVQHRMTKYQNNIVEQDHRFIKKIVKPMMGFHSYKSACATLAGIELICMIYKGQAGKTDVISGIKHINRLFDVAKIWLGFGWVYALMLS